MIADSGIATEMERVFAADLERCVRIELATVNARGVFAKVRGALCYWLRAQL